MTYQFATYTIPCADQRVRIKVTSATMEGEEMDMPVYPVRDPYVLLFLR